MSMSIFVGTDREVIKSPLNHNAIILLKGKEELKNEDKLRTKKTFYSKQYQSKIYRNTEATPKIIGGLSEFFNYILQKLS